MTDDRPPRSSLHAEVDGAGPRLVLVHGFTQTAACWGPVATDLATDHEVCRVDAPGHGRSASVAAGLRDGADLIADRGGRATYVGYSMGGRFALHVALARPELVAGLVLVGATAGIVDADARAERAHADEARAARLERDGLEDFLDAWLAQPLFAGLDDATQFRAERAVNTVAGLATSLRLAGTGRQEPLDERLGHLTMPVFAIAGERDTRFTAEAERIVAAVGANAEVAVVADAGHAAHLERPAAFLAALRPWLARHHL